mgnify:CR=1 FL=1
MQFERLVLSLRSGNRFRASVRFRRSLNTADARSARTAQILAEARAEFGPGVVGRTAAGAPALDVPAVVTVALAREGLAPPEDCGACTATTPGYFSHRRDGGVTGRQGVVGVIG